MSAGEWENRGHQSLCYEVKYGMNSIFQMREMLEIRKQNLGGVTMLE